MKGYWLNIEELAPARRRRRGTPHLQAPTLTQQQYAAVHDLASALILETDIFAMVGTRISSYHSTPRP